MNKTIGILINIWPKDYRHDRDRIKVSLLAPRSMYKKVLAYKAMPRTEEYMETLFKNHFPEGKLLYCKNQKETIRSMEKGDKAILLYPDSIGHGFRKIEAALTTRGIETSVLNGRGRLFALDRKTWNSLRLRRAVESLFLIELAATLIFLAATPFLLAWDILRGRA
ncbi:MAG: hypothetical protein A2X49_17030 [Lentisphaerae bacterium GWF2_52_8]|nr:MAG: hypothetical protein A2X49_17030 [Lentisphaerae bacterium GWF2_52_8]